MSTILLRCRDADMMGPVCDYISEDDPFDDTVKDMNTHAQIHNEPEITDDDVAELQELLMGGDLCCEDECCC